MNCQIKRFSGIFWSFVALLVCSTTASAQVAVPEVEEIQEIPVISAAEIEELVGPIALYPDDLLAIVLPAATFPLQVVEAGRFLAALEDDPSLEPDDDWDDSIIALVNYPEVVELMNEDLDWTWRLGEAVVGQQSDVIAAIEKFRDQAYAAGNLKSDDYQLVAEEGGTIQITPVEEDVIYVPYYEPSQVVVYQPRPVYFYYPRPYPVYYYPYPSYYSFHDHFHHRWFWGVTTAFSIAWHSHHLSVYHHSFYGHPYYGHTYWDRWWYRRPDIHIHNNIYVRNNVNVSRTRYRNGDYWLPSNRRTVSYSDQRITRSRFYPNSNTPARTTRSSTSGSRGGSRVVGSSNTQTRSVYVGRGDEREKIEFRPRSSTTSPNRNTTASPTRTRTDLSAALSRQTSQQRTTSVQRTTRPKVATESRSSFAPRPSSQPTAATRAPAQPRVSAPSSPQSPAARAPTTRSSFAPKSSTSRSGSGNRPSTSRSNSTQKSSVSRSSSAPKPEATRSSSSRKSEAKRSDSSSRSSQSSRRSSRKKER
ncbi:MAG: DUF3300 domain-containing protein [Woeseiaceae bacterium]|nr:DUF3300 domain-containing protein [Woeseiaceae bacterium]NIP19923.1 DUF3300 domain-containing protein [Woeseiaceae bacterium]NIS88724.1 DUF3300 domain-containing protein [Woeseiaceae bacterium]